MRLFHEGWWLASKRYPVLAQTNVWQVPLPSQCRVKACRTKVISPMVLNGVRTSKNLWGK